MKAWEPPKFMTTDEENYFTGQGLRKEPAPDLLALLKQCKPWLEAYKGFLCDDDRENRFHTEELDALLSDIAKAEEAK